jgi:transcriptional antiterminator RfaH
MHTPGTVYSRLTHKLVNAGTEGIGAPSIAELWTDQGGSAWYCIRTHLKHEHIAAAHLHRMCDIEVFNPQLRILRSTRRGRRWSTESLFPNYVFARFVLEPMLEKVRYTPAVKFVLRFGDRVPAIPAVVIDDLRQELAAMNSEVLSDTPLAGEEVEVAAGAFVGTKALVASVLPGKERVRILLDVMGREVPVELSLDRVLFDRRTAAKIALKPSDNSWTSRRALTDLARKPTVVCPVSPESSVVPHCPPAQVIGSISP